MPHIKTSSLSGQGIGACNGRRWEPCTDLTFLSAGTGADVPYAMRIAFGEVGVYNQSRADTEIGGAVQEQVGGQVRA